MTYQDLKFAISDGVCAAVENALPQFFANSCTRLADGFILTIEILVITVLLGGGLAVFAARARISDNPFISAPVAAFSYVFRGTPLLVQLWFIYFGIGSFGEASLGPLWPFFREGYYVGLLVLTLNTAAYVSEILRGGLSNVPKGQLEAGMSIGLSDRQLFWRIRLPLAVRTTLAAYGNEVILLLKGSALISTITVMDLMGQTRTVFARSYNLEIYLWSALLYLILAGLLTAGFWMIEQRLRRSSQIQ